MILEYGCKNCWSFKDWMVINFRINKNVPSEFAFPNTSVVPAVGFFGANASGKTSALRVISFLSDFIVYSFQHNPKQDILFDSYFERY